jgi:hypothetical protein
MALAKALQSEKLAYRKLCKIGLFVESLSSADAAAFKEAVDLIVQHRRTHGLHNNSGYTSSWLRKVVETETGHKLRIEALQRHIVGNCLCESS